MSEPINAADLRPCDLCGGRMVPTFFRVRVDHAVVDQRASNAMAGTAHLLGGTSRAWDIARTMSPCDPIATVATTKTMLLCVGCFCGSGAIASLWSDEAKESGA